MCESATNVAVERFSIASLRIVVVLFINLIPDYVSLLESRYILRRMIDSNASDRDGLDYKTTPF
jgi:hypothetical protein